MEPLMKKIASNFYQVPFEDLMQAGRIGVLKALKNYKEHKNVKFSTYAYDYILGEMYEYACKDQKMKVNKEVLRLTKQIQIARNALSQKYMRDVSLQEVAQFLELDESLVEQAITATREMVYLDAPREEMRDYYETIAEKESIPLDEKLSLYDSLRTLPREEQKILNYRYFEDLTQSETAKKMGMTQVMVSRYEKKSLRQLKRYYEVA
ncbi:MAG: hypothetical protein IJ743_04620 [Bacilli bacterium]|nr:hypothetical protein [Bacilli bacterium]